MPSPFTTPLLDTKSLGPELIWSAGPKARGNSAPDLYRYVPGEETPNLLFSNPRQTSNLTPIAGSEAGYLFGEVNYDEYGDGAWRLWYLDPEGGQPKELDRNQPPGDAKFPPPTIAMDDNRIVWSRFRTSGSNVTTELRIVNISDLESPQTVYTSEPDEEIWFPTLHGTDLWFGLATATSTGFEWAIYRLDLSDLTSPPLRFPADGNAFLPVVNQNYVAWKSGGEGALSWGTLTLYSRSTQVTTPVRIPAQPLIDYPSIGDRFLAFWGSDDTRFWLVDLDTGTYRLVADFPRDGAEGIVRPSVAGDLLSFVKVGREPLELYWAKLPD